MERLTGWELADSDSDSGPGMGPPADPDSESGPPADPGSGPSIADSGMAPPPPEPLRLTDEQEQAVGRRGEPLLLAAGAGSGKTSVLVERFVRAVREDGIAPERILAITFTDRAAGELGQRVRARLLELGEPRAARASEGAFLGTFHSFCAHILRVNARAAGLRDELQILDESLSGRLRRQAFAEALGQFLQGERGEAVDLIASYTADRARATVLGVYAELRSRGQRAPRLPEPGLGGASAAWRQEQLRTQAEREAQSALDAQGARAVALWNELLERFDERYEQAKHARGGVDFDDLELLAGELLSTDAERRRKWAERFELLMVDELQDVNPRQLALVRALERENLFTVGDEWQSIYGFRHADVGLFRSREAELAPRGQSLRLMHNFRARGELLEAVNAVFARRFGGTFTPLRPGRRSSSGTGEREARGEPLIELLLSDRRGWEREDAEQHAPVIAAGSESGATAWREAEAQALARRVSELIGGGQARAGGVAVLLRAVSDIECYEQALRRQGLRTVASAGAFWARQEIADLLAYLRALADPGDELALYGALACPPVSLSSDGMGLLARAAREQERSVWEIARDRALGSDAPDGAGAGTRPIGGAANADTAAGLPAGELERAATLCAWLERERMLLGELTLGELLERKIERGGHGARLRAGENGERRVANVRKLVELARAWEHSEGRDLRGFLEEAAFQQQQAAGAGTGGRSAGVEAIAEPDAPVDGETLPDAVRLMSVHAAKGLEFDVVCVADLGRAPSMGMPDLLVGGDCASRGGDGRIGVRLLGLEDREPRPALEYAQLADERRQAQAQEEDRILYVAMTRARERLLLSGAVDFAGWPRERLGAAPIVWLGPALAPELPALCAQAVVSDPPAAGDRADHPAGETRQAQAREDRPSPAWAPTSASASPSVSMLALTVDGTDVPLCCEARHASRARKLGVSTSHASDGELFAELVPGTGARASC